MGLMYVLEFAVWSYNKIPSQAGRPLRTRVVAGRFRTRGIKPSLIGWNLVMICKSVMCYLRYELGVLPMESKTVLLMVERFAQLSG